MNGVQYLKKRFFLDAFEVRAAPHCPRREAARSGCGLSIQGVGSDGKPPEHGFQMTLTPQVQSTDFK
jgi:hypothetical protein